MANEKNIIMEIQEVAALVYSVSASVKALVEHPAYNRVMEFGEHLEAFAKAQPKPIAPKPVTRVRRTKAEIEAERLARESANGKG